MKLYSENYLPRGYPDPPDDGTWDNEGGFIGRRTPTCYQMPMPLWGLSWCLQDCLVMDPETYAEAVLAIEKQK